ETFNKKAFHCYSIPKRKRKEKSSQGKDWRKGHNLLLFKR
ncbi:unnamed protein product, partial [marine sediment metagenome]